MSKVVIITGASQGIGAAVVHAYRALDYRVVATSRSIQPCTDPNIHTVAGDIADPATAERVIREGVARFGRIDSLINNAIEGVPSVLASLTKGGLNAATKSLAIEYAKRGIRVNAVSPGIIKTPMHGEETHAALGSLHPVGHMGEASDIAQAIIYLENAGFVTGEILHVDGGQSAGH
ncbi:SDR family NAD(P)-dependent oxidoreductase [Pseudomonas sp. 1152_12]|uniref:SDR family NAD(P)-dependent oxidoreductase n=1 Tax=Pseudomonas sp. 1152_12 TaxID=2604455 RepID=UPI004063F121